MSRGYYSAYASFITLCLWLSGGFGTCHVLGTQQMLPKSSIIQSHEFASSFLILSVHFLEIVNEWFFIHGHALRARQLFTGTSVVLITGISAVLRGSHEFIPLLSKRGEIRYSALSHKQPPCNRNSSNSPDPCTVSDEGRWLWNWGWAWLRLRNGRNRV